MRCSVTLLGILYLTGCTGAFTPNGIAYDIEDGLDAPIDLAGQIDAAWARAARASQDCSVLLDVEDLRDAVYVEVRAPANLVWEWDDTTQIKRGDKVGGLARPSTDSIEIALVGGRIPSMAHEFFHLMLARGGVDRHGDVGHVHPCWKLVNGDTK